MGRLPSGRWLLREAFPGPAATARCRVSGTFPAAPIRNYNPTLKTKASSVAVLKTTANNWGRRFPSGERSWISPLPFCPSAPSRRRTGEWGAGDISPEVGLLLSFLLGEEKVLANALPPRLQAKGAFLTRWMPLIGMASDAQLQFGSCSQHPVELGKEAERDRGEGTQPALPQLLVPGVVRSVWEPKERSWFELSFPKVGWLWGRGHQPWEAVRCLWYKSWGWTGKRTSQSWLFRAEDLTSGCYRNSSAVPWRASLGS